MPNVSSVDFVGHLRHAGKLWYLVNPYETTFEFPHQVPDYQQQVWFPFFVFIIVEQIILISKSKGFRLNDQVTSLSHWLFQETGRIFFRGAEYYAYIVIHERYHWWDLPWDSAWTWCITAVGVDFCYYWVHRSNHEVHFLWAHHQVHHSSEEFNLAVGLRQSVLQHWCNFVSIALHADRDPATCPRASATGSRRNRCPPPRADRLSCSHGSNEITLSITYMRAFCSQVLYLPLAFFIPPSHFIAHNQFNLIYQLWIHTTVIDDLGPLESIFNTPKHHRVHHGCNLYCLDKNYGGVLIVWDKLFGTFMEEKERDEIIYGLVVSPQSFNPLYLQVFYTVQLLRKSLQMSSLTDMLAVFWKGPSWFPGSPRLGLDEYKINVTSRIKYDSRVPPWQTFYIIVHFCLVFYSHLQLCDETRDLRTISSGFVIINNLFALTAIGLLFDKSVYAGVVEFIRCSIYLSFSAVHDSMNVYVYHAYVASCCVWILYFVCKAKSSVTNIKK